MFHCENFWIDILFWNEVYDRSHNKNKARNWNVFVVLTLWQRFDMLHDYVINDWKWEYVHLLTFSAYCYNCW